ncbi:MAG: GTPase HflX [Armatimonadota bacterium]
MSDIIGMGLERRGEEIERALLIGTHKLVGEGARSMDELKDLARAAGAEPVAVIVQVKEAPHQSTFFGKGKIEELKAAMAEYDAQVILVDGELSPRQVRNLVDAFEGKKILDRTELILDIFAQHAHTAEGKLQVELAQLSYLLPRLSGRGKMMDRIGGGAAGGVGTRGPGETKLETDRRRLRARIAHLKDELDDVSRRRGVEREQRRKAGSIVVSLVGYTNAGKSTLLNALAGSQEVSVRDRLFETLDPTTRKIEMAGHEILLSDTVGFIHDLPKQLVEAFRATLEEVVEADLLIHVVDASSDHWLSEKISTLQTLRELEVDQSPIITALNKWDLVPEENQEAILNRNPDAVTISALTGFGLDELREEIAARAFHHLIPLQLELPYNRMDLINLAHAHGRVIETEYVGEHIKAEVEIEEPFVEKFRQFVVAE